jgi:hypothetical protein
LLSSDSCSKTLAYRGPSVRRAWTASKVGWEMPKQPPRPCDRCHKPFAMYATQLGLNDEDTGEPIPKVAAFVERKRMGQVEIISADGIALMALCDACDEDLTRWLHAYD